METAMFQAMQKLLTNNFVVELSARKKYSLDERWNMFVNPSSMTDLNLDWVPVKFSTNCETLTGRITVHDIRDFVVLPGDTVLLDDSTHAQILSISGDGMSAVVECMSQVTVDIRRIRKA